MLSRLLGVAIVAALVGTATPADAETKRAIRPAKTVVKQAPKRKPLRLNFTDEVVSAGRATGNGSVLWGGKLARFPHLLLVRPSFHPELIKSAEKI